MIGGEAWTTEEPPAAEEAVVADIEAREPTTAPRVRSRWSRGGGDTEATLAVMAAGLIAVGFTLPFWVTDIGGVRTSGLTFSDGVGGSWPVLGAAALAVAGAVDRLRGITAGVALAASSLVAWAGMLLILVGTTEATPFSYGPGAVAWFAALLPAAVVAVAALLAAVRTTPLHVASPAIGAAVGVGGAVWVGAHLLPGDGDQGLLDGPLLADVGRLGWVVAVAGAVYLAATRRTPVALALVAGQAAAWSMWWADRGNLESLTWVFQPWAVDVLFGLGVTVAGTAAALGMVQGGFASGRVGPEAPPKPPPMSLGAFVALIVIPLLGAVGFVT